jgi:hypothetical protein
MNLANSMAASNPSKCSRHLGKNSTPRVRIIWQQLSAATHRFSDTANYLKTGAFRNWRFNPIMAVIVLFQQQARWLTLRRGRQLVRSYSR